MSETALDPFGAAVLLALDCAALMGFAIQRGAPAPLGFYLGCLGVGALAGLPLLQRLPAPYGLGSSAGDRSVVRSDLNMLVALSGRERTVPQFSALFDAAGLALETITLPPDALQILEAVAQDDSSRGERE